MKRTREGVVGCLDDDTAGETTSFSWAYVQEMVPTLAFPFGKEDLKRRHGRLLVLDGVN